MKTAQTTKPSSISRLIVSQQTNMALCERELNDAAEIMQRYLTDLKMGAAASASAAASRGGCQHA